MLDTRRPRQFAYVSIRHPLTNCSESAWSRYACNALHNFASMPICMCNTSGVKKYRVLGNGYEWNHKCRQITMNLNELSERITICSLYAYFLTWRMNDCRCTHVVYCTVHRRQKKRRHETLCQRRKQQGGNAEKRFACTATSRQCAHRTLKLDAVYVGRHVYTCMYATAVRT